MEKNRYSIDVKSFLGSADVSDALAREVENAMKVLNRSDNISDVFDYFCKMCDEHEKRNSFEEHGGRDIYITIGLCLIHKIKVMFHTLGHDAQVKLHGFYLRYYYSKQSCDALEHKLLNILQFYMSVQHLPTFSEYAALFFESSNNLLCGGDCHPCKPTDFANFFYRDDMQYVRYHTMDSFRKRMQDNDDDTAAATLDKVVECYVCANYFVQYYTDYLLLHIVYENICEKLFLLDDCDFNAHFDRYIGAYHNIFVDNPTSVFRNLFVLCHVRRMMCLCVLNKTQCTPLALASQHVEFHRYFLESASGRRSDWLAEHVKFLSRQDRKRISVYVIGRITRLLSRVATRM